MGVIYKQHQNRMQYLKTVLRNVIEIWECDFNSMLKENEEFKNFFEKNNDNEPIIPRNAVFGGRVNAAKLYYKCSENERIRHSDICSLYPDVQANGVFPIGTYKIYKNIEPNKTIFDYFGLVKCSVVPPRKLYFPVLPLKINNKLIFTLCTSCASTNEQQNECSHSDEQRMLKGTWVTLEVEEALKMNYRLHKVHEIWHFENKSNSLFREYVNLFLKSKVEASGLPSSITSISNDNEREIKINQFIQEYEEREGIKLNRDNIRKNEGQRAISKKMLNSHWGKYAENSLDRVYLNVVSQHHELMNLLLDDRYIIMKLLFNKNNCQVYYKYKKDEVEANNKTNVIIAAFVTAQARLKLYSALKNLNQRAIYYDTDSVMYIDTLPDCSAGGPAAGACLPAPFAPTKGKYLGEWIDELDEDDYIIEMVAPGPKNYAYTTIKGKKKCICKGLTLRTREAKSKINFDAMKNVITCDIDSKITVSQFKMKRDSDTWTISNCFYDKIYQFVYDKRRIVSTTTTTTGETSSRTYETLPFGW
jgi:hypothetical protein